MGEGLLNRDECDPALCEHPSSSRNKATNVKKDKTADDSDLTLTVDDISDLKLARYSVSVDSVTSSTIGSLSVENMVARTMMHFHSVYSVATFCLHVNNRPPEELIRLQGSQSVFNTVIVIRLMNKDFKASIQAHSKNGGMKLVDSLADCVKVSYCVGDALLLLAGTETRIPLSMDEFRQVRETLDRRSRVFGMSPFKNQSISVLFR